MARRGWLSRTSPTLLAGIAGFGFVLLSAQLYARDGAARALRLTEEHALTVVSEPAVFVGRVEVTSDPQRGRGLLISTATEEVVIANNAVAKTLMEFEGEIVAVQGRLIERPQAPPTLVVREFRVLGLDPRTWLRPARRSMAC